MGVIQKSSSTESEDFTDSDGELSTYYYSHLPSSLQTLSQEVVSPILDEIIMKVTKNLEKSTTEPGLKNEKINSTENENNTLSFHKEPEKSLTTSKKSVKSHIPLVPYLVDE